VPKDIKQESINLFNKVGRDKFILILQKLIQDFNKEEAEEDFPLDSQRLIRNHSLLIHTGKPLQYYKKLPRETHYPSEHFIKIAILPDRGKSYQKINERFVQNVDCYVNEVKNTMKDVDEMHNIYKAHGFREIKDYILGNITKEQMIDMATMQVRRYNKRQRTWINNKFKDFQIVNESSQDVLI
jgi:tRNA dimethylallyltransferase